MQDTKTFHPDDDDARLDDALAEYYEAIDDNRKFDLEDLVAKYPDLDDRIHEHIDGEIEIELAHEQKLNEQDSLASSLLEQNGAERSVFRIVRKIGSGGMGVVYLAEETGTVTREVALKLIKSNVNSDEFLSRFNIERQALAMLNHPNVAIFYAAGTAKNGQPFYAMEYVEGKKLLHYCDGQQLTVRQRLEIFCSICDGVEHAHQKGIIHRDLKPSNILVSEKNVGDRPTPKIIDFGLAKALQGHDVISSDSTALSEILGTFRYMSPEQASRSPNSIVDTRTDIYSLGVILFELLCGATPFDAASLRQLPLKKIVSWLADPEIKLPSEYLSALDDANSIADQRQISFGKLQSILKGDLDWVVAKALAPLPDQRYPTANELKADIVRFLEDEPVLARPPSLLYRSKRFVDKHWSLVLATSFAFFIVLSSLVVTLVLLFRAVNAEELAKKSASKERQARLQANQRLEVLQRMFGDFGGKPVHSIDFKKDFGNTLVKAADELMSISSGEEDKQMLTSLAWSLLRARRPMAAERVARFVLQDSNQLDAPHISSKLALAESFANINEYEKVVELLEPEIRMHLQSKQVSVRGKLNLVYFLANAYANLGSHDQSLQIYSLAEDQAWASSMQYPELSLRIKWHTAIEEFKISPTEDALQKVESLAREYQETLGGDPLGLSRGLLQVYSTLNKHKEAVELSERLLAEQLQKAANYETVMAYHNLVVALRKALLNPGPNRKEFVSQLRSIMPAADGSLEKFALTTEVDLQNAFAVWSNISIAHAQLGDRKKSIEAMRRMLAIAEERHPRNSALVQERVYMLGIALEGWSSNEELSEAELLLNEYLEYCSANGIQSDNVKKAKDCLRNIKLVSGFNSLNPMNLIRAKKDDKGKKSKN